MKNSVALTVGYLAMMGGLIVLLDILFLRDHFWWRLGVNIAIVAVFAIGYFALFRSTPK